MLEKVQLSAIYEISKTLSSSLDYPKNISYITNLLNSYFGYENVFITIVDPETQELKNFGKEDVSYKKGEGITGKVWKHGVPIVIPNIFEEKEFLNKLNRDLKKYKNKKVAFISVPIKIGNRIIGVLGVDKPYTGQETLNEHTKFLTMVSVLLGHSIELSSKIHEEKKKLEEEKAYLKNQVKTLISKTGMDGIIGRSKKILEIVDMIRSVAPTSATVLLTGESGVGKEVFAKAIHYSSPRKDKPFIKINCAAIPEDLLESELFGYEKGAFTGANTLKKGKFELAHGGTIFLDEIGDMPLLLQSKLLRVLQEKEVERLGGSKPIKIDVRIIAATNKDLEKMVYEGTFREDLYYRLNVISIHIPPLRERKEDIPSLVYHFLEKFSREYNKNLKISEEVIDVFLNYHWPGNVRQLQNTIERMVILAKGDILTKENLPLDIKRQLSSIEKKTSVNSSFIKNIKLPKTVEELEKEAIIKALEETNYVIKKAAEKLGMTPRQVRYRIDKYKIPLKK
jgi:Nif-specific regulatory protein